MSTPPLKISADRLVHLGYRGLTAEQLTRLQKELYNACEEIVGAKLATRMSMAQLDAFERIIDADDDAAALAWLDRNIPDYRDIVRDTLAELEATLRAAADEITRTAAEPHNIST